MVGFLRVHAGEEVNVSNHLSFVTSIFGVVGQLLPVPTELPAVLIQAATLTVSLAILTCCYRPLSELVDSSGPAKV
jgi:hypothetical protein